MKSKITCSLVILITSLSPIANGQGCSDAGICTLESFKPNTADSSAHAWNQLNTSISYGSADHDITVVGAYIVYNRTINPKLGIDSKITMLSQSDNNLTTYGLADFYITANYKLNKNIKLTIGSKIPFSDGNKMKDNMPLPMDFQASLGTLDLIFGMGIIVQGWQLVAAIQQPLTQNNNKFIASDYPLESAFRRFQSTNNYQRSGDVLLRLSYPVNFGPRFRFTPSLLPIYHLANDKFTDSDGLEKEIIGSQGLTLNANTYFDWQISLKNSLQLNVGAPLIIRDARPDGLTRHFLASVEYRFFF